MPTDYEQRFRSAMSRRNQPSLVDAKHRLIDTDDNSLGVLTTQHIPDSFLDDLAQRRLDSARAPIGDFALLARIPEAMVIKWYREGKNVYEADAREISKWLKEEEAGHLFATRKQLI